MKKKLCIGIAALAAGGIIAGAALYGKTGKALWLIMVFAAVAVLLIALYGCITKKAQDVPSDAPRYHKKRTYITRAEWEFLQLLRSILGDRYEVCVQAPLVSVLEKESGGFRNELFRVVDYLIVEPVSFAPLLFVELNDASHNRPERVARDEKVFSLCAAADMPIIAFTTAESHDAAFVRKKLMKLLK
ncbi:MAG: DUF2726 domain-containing protein [Clostridiales bacterium]|nr:DUF2726 domain-containing protein [Clostridiales bacterium]